MKINVKARPARDHPGAASAQRGQAGALRQRSGVKTEGAALTVNGGQTRTANGLIWLADSAGFDRFCADGYVRLSACPEIMTGVDTIASLIGAMTIYLMENTDRGDVRVRDSLSELVDIAPNRYMTRSALIQWIVRTLYLDGRGNAVIFPRTERGQLRELIPIPAPYVSYVPVGLWDYMIAINGAEFRPSDLLHFTLNPGSVFPWLGEGPAPSLNDVAANLKEAAKTTRGFMKSEYKPSLIVKADGVDGLDTPEGRKKVLDNFVRSSDAGEPWLLPAEQFEVKEIRPLSLSDLALADFVKLDKETVAAVLGVPAFVLGVGEFKRDQWNNFISAYIMPKAKMIEQVLTRGLVMDPRQFFRFNPRSLYSYDLKDLANIAGSMAVRGLMTGNEARDWIGLDPKDGLDDLAILENFIPRDRIGDQEKLTGGENS